jgi:ribosomal protein S18 acetylase RimI-like enzyme
MGADNAIPYGRVQAYLRHVAQRQYEAVSVPPFSVFFHPTDALEYFNYAIPDEPAGGDLTAALAELSRVFAGRGRTPRFEFMERYAPQLPEALLQAGLVEEARQHMLVCTPDELRAAPPVPGLDVTTLTADSPVGQAVEFLDVQRLGFDPDATESVTPEAAEVFLQQLGEGRAFMARLAGKLVGVGLYTAPYDGLVELAGIAVLAEYRRRGIAAALTSRMLGDAFGRGVEIAVLIAEDERAGRVYERVGFSPYTTMLAYRAV